jgi:hypothetical protein
LFSALMAGWAGFWVLSQHQAVAQSLWEMLRL